MKTFSLQFLAATTLGLIAGAALADTCAVMPGGPPLYSAGHTCPAGQILKPANCGNLYYCANDPNYVPPPGVITGMTVAKNPIYFSDPLYVNTSGSGKCHYAFQVRDVAKNLLIVDTGTMGTGYAFASGSHTIAMPSNVNYGTSLAVSVYNPANEKNVCAQLPPPVAVQVLPKPVTLYSNMISLHSMNPAHFNAPFPLGDALTYDLFVAAWHPGCVLDVSLTGPEGFNRPGEVFDFPASPKTFNVSHAGNYTLTMKPSANAPMEKRCTGAPISKSFNVLLEMIKIPVPVSLQPLVKP